jgi:hypothetical protein
MVIKFLQGPYFRRLVTKIKVCIAQMNRKTAFEILIAKLKNDFTRRTVNLTQQALCEKCKLKVITPRITGRKLDMPAEKT